MKAIQANPDLVAYCGLYCGACSRYLKDKCQGCHENAKVTWCKVRTCCIDNKYLSCADCKQFGNPDDCKLFNNMMAKIFALIFRSDRGACIRQIKENGIPAFADDMAANRRVTLKK